jgi:hypothetical protein
MMHALSFVIETQPGFLKRKVEKERGKAGKNGNPRGATGGNGKKRNLQTIQALMRESNPKHKQQKHLAPKPTAQTSIYS